MILWSPLQILLEIEEGDYIVNKKFREKATHVCVMYILIYDEIFQQISTEDKPNQLTLMHPWISWGSRLAQIGSFGTKSSVTPQSRCKQ